VKRQWWAAGAAFLLGVAACAPPNQAVNNIAAIESPSPTPSPTSTATAAFSASGPGFHAGEVGVDYAPVVLTAAGGVQPYHWSVSAGSLPAGLTLGADGKLSGSPAAAGTFTFTIQASDSAGGAAAIPGAIKVAGHLAAKLLPACAQYCRVELGCSNACGAFGTYSGGIAPYTFSVIHGPLPVGTALSPNALTLNGTFGGQSGFLPFTVQAADALGATTALTPTFWMYPHVSLASATCGNPNSPGKCTVTMAYSGGTPGQSLALTATAWAPLTKCGIGAVALPCQQPALAVSFSGGQATVTLTYGGQSPYTYGTLTVQLSSSDVCAPATACTATATITVNG
jgi:large repetitive protein